MRKLKLISVVLVVVMIAGCAAVLSSCEQKKEEKEEMTLESYLAESENGVAELNKINETLSNENMEGKVEVKDNAVTMTMTLTQSIDEKYFDKIEESINDMIEKHGNSFRDTVNSLEEDAEVSGVTVEFVVLNADGTEICRKSL